MKKIHMRIVGLLVVMMTGTVLFGCQADESEQEADKAKEMSDHPVVVFTMDNDEQIYMELYEDLAPNTVNNFIALIEDDFYDGLIFHRVIPGFMIQGGDPDGQGTGGPGHSIKGEFSSNGFDNDLSHEKGILSMARSPHPDSAGSQFYITVEDSPHLDGDYAGFGKVLEGMDIADDIAGVERDPQDKPVEDQVIKTAEVYLNGYEPGEVEKE